MVLRILVPGTFGLIPAYTVHVLRAAGQPLGRSRDRVFSVRFIALQGY